MIKFSKILESADSDIVLDIRDILMDFKDAGFEIDIKEIQGTYTIKMNLDGTTDVMECIQDITVANNRIKDLGLSYQTSLIAINTRQNPNLQNILLVYKKNDFAASKDIHGWKEFKGYCEKVLGIDGIRGADTFDPYFRINVVDKDAGWPGLPDDMAGWSLKLEFLSQHYERDKANFLSQFPGYEAFLNKLLSRQISYDLVWHLCNTGPGVRISDPAKLEEAKKKHNPMKFDREGIEAIETLVEMGEKFPDNIEIIKHKI